MVIPAEDTIVINADPPTEQSIELERQQQFEALTLLRRALIDDTFPAK